MFQVLAQLPKIKDKNVLIDSSNADDAGVYRITDEIAVVLTVDFFTPIVDDPYWFGAIAAANSLSDVYAMGGSPVAALNVAMFPEKPEFFPTIRKVLQGGNDKMSEAGVSIIGGHTIKDKEPKYGFAVLGLIHPDKILDNSKARAGDAMILTKKIGTGIIAKAVKDGVCSDKTIKAFTKSMAILNKRTSEIMLQVGVSTSTDITGFGLLGHMYEVLSASKVSAHVYSSRVPFFADAVPLAEIKKVPGGSVANRKNFETYIKWGEDVSETEKYLLNDAQTSGGLLIFVPRDRKDKLVSALQKEHILAAHIGDVSYEGIKDDKRIFVDQ